MCDKYRWLFSFCLMAFAFLFTSIRITYAENAERPGYVIDSICGVHYNNRQHQDSREAGSNGITSDLFDVVGENRTIVTLPCNIVIKQKEGDKNTIPFLAVLPRGAERCYRFPVTTCDNERRNCFLLNFNSELFGDDSFSEAILYPFIEPSVSGKSTFDCPPIENERTIVRLKILRKPNAVLNIKSVRYCVNSAEFPDGCKPKTLDERSPLIGSEHMEIALPPNKLTDRFSQIRVLTRYKGNSTWFAQYPAVSSMDQLPNEFNRRSSQSSIGRDNAKLHLTAGISEEQVKENTAPIIWRQDRLLFPTQPNLKPQLRSNNNISEYEVIVAETIGVLPTGWVTEEQLRLKAARLSSIFTVFAINHPAPEARIIRIGSNDNLSLAKTNIVEDRAEVELSISSNQFHSAQIFLGLKCDDENHWRVFPVRASGDKFISLEPIEFFNCDRKQILGIVSVGDLVAKSDVLTQNELVLRSLVTSETVSVTSVPEKPSLAKFSRIDDILFESYAPTSSLTMISEGLKLAFLVVIAIILIAVFWILTRKNSEQREEQCLEGNQDRLVLILEKSADVFLKSKNVVRESLTKEERNPGALFDLFVGIILFLGLWYGITQQFLKFYPEIIQTASGQSRSFGEHWATWIVMISVALGLFLHFSGSRDFLIGSLLLLSVIIFPVMQGFVYVVYLNKISNLSVSLEAFEISGPIFAFLVGFCFSAVEFCGTYFVLNRTERPIKWLIKEFLLVLLSIPHYFFRTLQYLAKK